MPLAAAFDELYVISDLHLGGVAGFQIFKQGAEAAWLLEYLRERRPDRQVGLVVNGDLIDFLAEPDAKYFDLSGAGAKLDRIVQDPAFAPVFDGLRAFAATPNRSLIIALGNHDLELALPWVREQLLQVLSAGDPAARGRITLAFDGIGFTCEVGSRSDGVEPATILCLHGNEVDTWNITDFEALRRIGRDALRGGVRHPWIPNAGTRLVIDVMNEIKREFPFVDLLKPETEAVIPTLLALRPKMAARLVFALPAAGRLAWDAIRRATGFLSSEDSDAEENERSLSAAGSPTVPRPFGASEREGMDLAGQYSPARFLGAALEDAFAAKPGSPTLRFENVDDLLERTQDRLEQGVSPYELLETSADYQMLGIIGAIRDLITRNGASEVLREALEAVQRDQSYDLKQADKTYNALQRHLQPNIQFLVTGHTHLERALPLVSNGGAYFNSGTWVRLIRFSPGLLRDPKAFGEVFKVLAHGKMGDLDRCTYSDGALIPLVELRPTVVFIRTVAGKEGRQKVIGDLQRVILANPGSTLLPVPRSQFVYDGES